MGTYRSAPCIHLDGLVTDLGALIFCECPLLMHEVETIVRLYFNFFSTIFPPVALIASGPHQIQYRIVFQASFLMLYKFCEQFT